MVKLLAINGSPRTQGHTQILLDALLQGAETGGCQAELLHACRLQVVGCSGCNACAHTGECILQDDMQDVFRCMGEADIVVLASPLYFMGISGQLKLLVDRCQTCWNRRYELNVSPLLPQKNRQGFFLSTGGAPDKNRANFRPAIQTATYFFDAIGATYKGELTVANTDRVPISQQLEAMAAAESTGLALARGAVS